MSAATQDVRTKSRNAELVGYPVAASTELFAGTLLCLNASGYAVDGADTAGLTFAGICQRAVDNSDGAAGDETVEVWTRGAWLLTGSGFTAADVGELVYLIDNNTVGLAASASVDEHIVVGSIIEVVDSSTVYVDLQDLRPLAKRQLQASQWRATVAGADGSVTPAAVDLSVFAAEVGGDDFIVASIQAVEAYATADGAAAGLLVEDTDYEIDSGGINIISDQSANNLVITFVGRLT